MSERQYKVRCMGTDDPSKPYVLSYGKGGKKIEATLERDGQKFKCKLGEKIITGMIRELKDGFERFAIAAYSGTISKPRMTIAAKEPGEGFVAIMQSRIDNAETPDEAVIQWVQAYNIETVALDAAKFLGQPRERHYFVLPKTIKMEPPLHECYSPSRDQYVWPRRLNKDTGEITCLTTSNTESNDSTTTPTSSPNEWIFDEIINSNSDPLPSTLEALVGGTTA